MSKLGYFRSVEVPENVREAFTQLESVLQREHNDDGSHPLVTEGSDGFMTAEQLRMLNTLYDWYLKNEGTVGQDTQSPKTV